MNSFKNEDISSVFGNIQIQNKKGKIIREMNYQNWNKTFIEFGIIPPHPSFYCRKKIFDKYGQFDTGFRCLGARYRCLNPKRRYCQWESKTEHF